MARHNNLLTAEFKGFSGINIPLCHSGKVSIRNIENFEIDENGSLQKRCGYTHLFNFPEGEIKSIWSGKVGGKFKCYILSNSTLYEFHPELKTYSKLGPLSNGTEEISLFHYKDIIYLKDANALYRMEDSGMVREEGYVPLYGKDWGTTYPGDVYQPLNLLNRKARISYVVGEDHTSMLPAKFPVKSVISLYKNNELLPKEEYAIDARFNTINIVNGVNTGDTFYATVEFEENVNLEENYANECRYSKVLGPPESQRIAIWGATSNKSYMYLSNIVSEKDIANSEAVCPGSGSLYFKRESSFQIGDGSNGVTAVTRNYDRLLLFTENETWLSDDSVSANESFPLVNVSPAVGCTSAYGSASSGVDTVAISYQGIISWSSSENGSRELIAHNISTPINRDLSYSFFKNASVYNNAYKRQLWFLNPKQGSVAWIYGIDNGSWVKFTGFKNVKGFFELDGLTAFYTKYDVFVFSDELTFDIDGSGNRSTVVAKFESGILDFGSLENKKLTDFYLVADLGNDRISTTIAYNTGDSIRFSLLNGEEHSLNNRRMHSARFKSARLSFTTRGEDRQTVHYLRLIAKEK